MESNGNIANDSWLELPAIDLDLQLVKFDPTDNAPERDNEAEAPELLFSSDAPQTAYIEGPEVAFERSDLIASTTDPNRKSQTNDVQPLSPTALPKSILDGTSFAAVSTPEGNRHVFFQDWNGTLRATKYSHVSLSWVLSDNYVIATDARNCTPLSAIVDVREYSSAIYLFYILANNTLTVKQAAPTGTIMYQSFDAFGINGLYTAAKDSRSLSAMVLPNTPMREVCVLFEGMNHNITALHVVYTLDNPNLTMAHSSSKPWVWEDLTDSLMPRITTLKSDIAAGLGIVYLPNVTFGAPFASGIVRSEIQSYLGSHQPWPNSPVLSVIFLYKYSEKVHIMASHYTNGSFSMGQEFPDETDHLYSRPADYKFRQIIDSDIVMSNVDTAESYFEGPYALWVNCTTLSFGLNIGMQTLPISPFPYTRMAVTNPTNSTTLYLYHQINGTTIAEDVYDASDGSWTSSNITIAS